MYYTGWMKLRGVRDCLHRSVQAYQWRNLRKYHAACLLPGLQQACHFHLVPHVLILCGYRYPHWLLAITIPNLGLGNVRFLKVCHSLWGLIGSPTWEGVCCKSVSPFPLPATVQPFTSGKRKRDSGIESARLHGGEPEDGSGSVMIDGIGVRLA